MAIAMTATVGIGGPVTASGTAAAPSVTLEVLGTCASGVFDEGAAEILAHDPRTQRLFVVNSFAASIDVLDLHRGVHNATVQHC